MPNNESLKLLFVINPVSGGKEKINYKESILEYFKSSPHHLEIYALNGKNDKTSLQDYISKFQPDKVIAVGGDGTVKLVAEQIIHTSTQLGILPAGSANGMAAELKIPFALKQALDVVNNGIVKKISAVRINEKDISIHLSDIGLNALLVKYFEQSNRRGMWGYARVLFRVLRRKRLMKIELEINREKLLRAAFMIVIANAGVYGTGAVINPRGNLHDGKFEVVIVRRLSLLELFRMLLSHKPFNPGDIEVLQTEQAIITTHKKNHFQVDGEYRGKIDTIKAEIIPDAINVLLPDT
jgi:diacylglycerol kinase (ATP)